METKPGILALHLTPASNGVIVQKRYDPSVGGEVSDIPYVFTDHDELCRFLYNYFVDTEAELKKRAQDA